MGRFAAKGGKKRLRVTETPGDMASRTIVALHSRIEEIRQWMEEIDPEPEHGRQVTRLALMLFDRLAAVHALTQRERDLLEAAALLHDIGMGISAKRHHKRSYKLIKEHKFLTWAPEEVDVFALVARYHRKTAPSVRHAAFLSLPEGDRDVVRKLAAILRVADGLDRAHLSTIQEIDVECDARTIRMKLHADRDCSSEIWGAERKARFLENVFSRQLSIESVDGYRVRPS